MRCAGLGLGCCSQMAGRGAERCCAGCWLAAAALALALARQSLERRSRQAPSARTAPTLEQIPTWFALAGYLALLGLAAGVIPTIYEQTKW